jgi:hypothetical protein
MMSKQIYPNIKIKEQTMYTILYHTGAGDIDGIEEIEEAMSKADKGVAYTQAPITIEDTDGNEVARREWFGLLSGIQEYQDPISFGDFGFYGDWMVA